MNTADPHEASGAYALHALPEDERLAFERHLEGCEACREEVAGLQAAAALLGRAAAVAPPAALREEILRRVAFTPQDEPARAREVPAPPRRATAGQEPVAVTAGGRAPAWSRRLPRLALAASVAAVLACLGVATWQYREAQDARTATRHSQEHQEEVARVLTAPDVRLETQELRGGGTATVAVSRSEDAATLAVSGLPPLPAGKVYEAWFIEDGQPVPAGLLSRDPGRRLTLLDGPVDDATAVALSVEPAGGSEQPTTDPLGAVGLPT